MKICFQASADASSRRAMRILRTSLLSSIVPNYMHQGPASSKPPDARNLSFLIVPTNPMHTRQAPWARCEDSEFFSGAHESDAYSLNFLASKPPDAGIPNSCSRAHESDAYSLTFLASKPPDARIPSFRAGPTNPMHTRQDPLLKMTDRPYFREPL